MLTPCPSFRFEVRKDASCFLLPAAIVDEHDAKRIRTAASFLSYRRTRRHSGPLSRVGTMSANRAIRLPRAPEDRQAGNVRSADRYGSARETSLHRMRLYGLLMSAAATCGSMSVSPVAANERTRNMADTAVARES